MIDWLRKLVKDEPEISASKQEGRDVRAGKSSAAQRLLEALERLDRDPEHDLSVSRQRRRHGAGD